MMVERRLAVAAWGGGPQCCARRRPVAPFGGPGAHNGGRVRFGPDGALYLTTGDNQRRQTTTATERRVVVEARGVVPCPDVARVARSSRAISSERKLAIDSSVGWSNNAVGARSALNHAASVLTNSVVAIESRPADMSGAFISTTVPMTSRATARTSSRASIRRHVARP